MMMMMMMMMMMIDDDRINHMIVTIATVLWSVMHDLDV